MAEDKLYPGMLKNQERAVELTRMQIESALKLNTLYFDGEGLDQFGAILAALSTNFNAAVLYGKTMK